MRSSFFLINLLISTSLMNCSTKESFRKFHKFFEIVRDLLGEEFHQTLRHTLHLIYACVKGLLIFQLLFYNILVISEHLNIFEI